MRCDARAGSGAGRKRIVRVLLLQLDGKLPNIAIMRISAHHKALGDEVEFRQVGNITSLGASLFDSFDRVYASLIFTRTKPLAFALKLTYPDAIIGGTGWEMTDGELPIVSFKKKVQVTLESVGITIKEPDYSFYPTFTASIGHTQVGCSKKCAFCCVPFKEPELKSEGSIYSIWRGPSHPKHIHLLDNDFFGAEDVNYTDWRERIDEMKEGEFKVCFNQGINVRAITEETAAAIASVNYCDDQFKVRRLYTAWDSKHDEETLFNGLSLLLKHGIKPDHIMVYMLIGFWKDDKTPEAWEYRRRKLRKMGMRPYPMPFIDHAPDRKGRLCVCDECKQKRGYARYVIRRCDLMVSWQQFKAAHYQPANFGFDLGQMELPA